MPDAKEVAELIRQLVQTLDVRSMAQWRTLVREEGLSIPQMILLMRLHGGGSCGVHHLGHALGVSSAAVSQMVDRLVQAGFVEREESAEDRRVRQVQLSGRGRQLIDRAVRHRYQWVDELAGEIAVEDRAATGRVLKTLIHAEQRLPPAIPGHGKRP